MSLGILPSLEANNTCWPPGMKSSGSETDDEPALPSQFATAVDLTASPFGFGRFRENAGRPACRRSQSRSLCQAGIPYARRMTTKAAPMILLMWLDARGSRFILKMRGKNCQSHRMS
jgi:hypothetical protein